MGSHGIVVAGSCAVALAFVADARAQSLELASVATDGTPGNSLSEEPTVSDDGARVAFVSHSTNLVLGDTNAAKDVFVRDRTAGTTTRASVSSAGVQANAQSFHPRISADGSVVVFSTDASNLVSGDTNGNPDILVRDLAAGTTTRASLAFDGAQANGACTNPAVSADGRWVVFSSTASNLVAGDANGVSDIFLRDRVAGTTTLVSVSTAGVAANGHCDHPALSSDGRFVAFDSGATTLDPADGDTLPDVYLRDLVSGTTTLVSVATSGAKGNGLSERASLSDDGRLVAFQSYASNFLPGDGSGSLDVLVRDLVAGTTTTPAVDSDGVRVPNSGESWAPSISRDGRFVCFKSNAPALVDDDGNSKRDVFCRDQVGGTTVRLSRALDGTEADGPSEDPRAQADSRFVAFRTDSTNLVPGVSCYQQVVLRERRLDAAAWTNYGAGHPGRDGVPSLGADAPPVLHRDVSLQLGNSSGAWTIGLLLLGSARDQRPTGFDADLLLVPDGSVLLVLSPGGATFPDHVPPDDLLVGLVVDAQLLLVDPAASDGVAASAGLELVVGY